MALHWRPVGPEPAQTYWLRRALVAAGVLVVLALLVSAVGAVTGGSDTVAAVARPTPSVVPSPQVSPSPSQGPCDPDALKLAATADRESYPVGGTPRFTLNVTNTGTAPCMRDLGQAAVEIAVFSGSDRIWSSDDCAPGGALAVRTLQPGKAETVATTWQGTRSEPDCKGTQAAASAGTYRVDGRVGQLRFQGQTFRLTGG